MGLNIPGSALSYAARERKKYNEANLAYAIPSPQERALMKLQLSAVQQSQADRRATRNLILGQLGFKIGKSKDGKDTLVPLTNEERLQMMSEADKSRTSAQSAYTDRAKAALTGQTKLPSFLKQDVDYQKATENAMMEEMLGPDAMQSTAGQQAIEAMKNKERDIRQAITEQDLELAPGAASGLGEQMAARRGGLIGAYEALPNQGAGLIQARGSLIEQMQAERLGELNRRYAELENKRKNIENLYTLGGSIGGSIAAANAGGKKSATPSTGTSGGNIYSYVPNYQLEEPSMSLYSWNR